MNRVRLHSGVRVILAGWVLALAAVCLAQDPVDDPQEACAASHLKQSVVVGRYTFKTYRSGDYDANNCLKVIENGKVIFRRTLDSMQGYTLGQPEDKKWKVPGIPNGTDITGRGRPNMIVQFYIGGAHCCNFHYIFELEPAFKLVQTLDMRDTDNAYFAELDGNHQYYFIAEDWTFAYWPGPFSGSPFHSVVLKFVDDKDGGAYHLALDKMKKPLPTQEEWEKALKDVGREQHLEDTGWANGLETYLWQEVLDLLYTGHSDLAWKFLDETRSKAKKKEKFDPEGFCSVLKASPYWPDLAPSIQNMPPACAKATPDRQQMAR